ncbi:SpaA isopeptide-forming pilin-related protein [Bifidobacterium felsineum]|nr:SpaA isopeptide-forming pilin-related protein [Bifidobacterium felsineum]
MAGLVAGAMLFVGVPIASAVEAAPQSDQSTSQAQTQQSQDSQSSQKTDTKGDSAKTEAKNDGKDAGSGSSADTANKTDTQSNQSDNSDDASASDSADAQDDSTNAEDQIDPQSYEALKSRRSVRIASSVQPCTPDDPLKWGGTTVLSTDAGASIYAKRNMHMAVPVLGNGNGKGDHTQTLINGDGHPFDTGTPGYFVESEGVTVVGGNFSLNKPIALGNPPMGRVSWGGGHPAPNHGTALAVGGNANSYGTVVYLSGSYDTQQQKWLGTYGHIGLANSNAGGYSPLTPAINPTDDGKVYQREGTQKVLSDVNGVDYNNFDTEIKDFSKTLADTRPGNGVVYENVNFADASIEAAPATGTSKWIRGLDSPRYNANKGDSRVSSIKSGGGTYRYTQLTNIREVHVTFKGDNNPKNKLQVFTLNMAEVNQQFKNDNATGVYYDFQNIPEGASVLVNVTHTDDGSNLTMNTGWHFGWNGKDIQKVADQDDDYAVASGSIMWNFADVTGTLKIRNGDKWKTFPDSMKNDGLANYYKMYANGYEDDNASSDAGAALPGSVLAANAKSTETWVSTNGRLYVGGDLWLSQTYPQNDFRSDGNHGFGVGMAQEHHNFPWIGNAMTSCPVTGTVEWSKVDKDSTAKVLSGSEWKITSGSDTVATVVDNGENDADSRPGYLQVRGLSTDKTYWLTETKAPDGYQINTTRYSFTVTGNGITTLPVNGGKVSNTAYQGKAAWYKVDATSNKELAGSEWLLTCSSGECKDLEENNNPWSRKIVDKVSADDNRNEAQWDWSEVPGYIVIQNLPLNSSYTLEETKAPDNYQLNTSVYTLNVTDPYSYAYPTLQGQEVQRIPNEKLKGSLRWKKIEDNALNKPLAGSEWSLIGPCESSGECKLGDNNPSAQELHIVDNGDLDSDNRSGFFKVDNLAYGHYTLRETKAPDGYVINTTSYDREVNASTSNSNTFIPYSNSVGVPITWEKKDASNPNGDPLPGSKWSLTCTDMVAVGSTSICFEDFNGIVRNIADNDASDLNKTDGKFEVMLPIPSGSAWSITYELKETEAPEGYELSDAIWTLKISKTNGDITYKWTNNKNSDTHGGSSGKLDLLVTDKQKPGTLIWQKVDGADSDTYHPLDGSEWHLEAVDSVEGSAPADAPWSKCSYQGGCDVNNDNGMNESTYQTGTFQVSKLKPGDYKLTETKAPDGYALPDDAEYKVTVLPGQEVKVNGSGDVPNYPIVQVAWKKTDDLANALGGSEWKLVNTRNQYDSLQVTDNETHDKGGSYSGEDLDKRSGYFTVQVNPTRMATFSDPLTYELTETKAPDGYKLDQTVHTLYLYYVSTEGANGKWHWAWNYVDGAQDESISIENEKKPVLSFLPLTGGVGTARGMLAIGGGLALFIVVAGAIWHEWRKRKEELLL